MKLTTTYSEREVKYWTVAVYIMAFISGLLVGWPLYVLLS